MISRCIIEDEINKTLGEIESLKDQCKLKETYIDSLRKKLRELDELERMG